MKPIIVVAWILSCSEFARARPHRALSPPVLASGNLRHKNPILQIPRGGGSFLSNAEQLSKTMLTKTNAAKVITGYGVFQGLLSASDPEWFWKDAGDLQNVPRGSVAFWAGELNGLLGLSMSIISVLVMARTELSVFQAIGFGSVPSLLFFLTGMESGSLSKLGFTAVFGPCVILYIVAVLLAAFLPKAEWLRTIYLFTPLTLAGLYGWLFPAAAADDIGIAFKTATDKTLWVFLSSTLLSLSALIQALLKTGDVVTAIRSMSVMVAITTFDVKFVRPYILKDAGCSSTKSSLFTGFFLVLTALMFLLPPATT